jgi:hypothetical protein
LIYSHPHYADPQAQVQFVRTDASNSERVSVSNQVEGNSAKYELIINPFESEDAGQYRCYARNAHGDSQQTAMIEHEADDSFSYKTDRADPQASPDDPRVNINVRGSLENGNMVELNCALESN